MDASSVLSDDLSDYDVISDPGRRSFDSSIADFTFTVTEPPPTPEAYNKFATVRLTAADIQSAHRLDNRTKRVYVDGIFDIFNVGCVAFSLFPRPPTYIPSTSHALQLRQAKLSFPSVHLIVGVFPDELCEAYGTPTVVPHLERCEILRHCRWVDQVLPDAPWQINDQFIREQNIDYVVVDEGATIDPACDKVRLKGYDAMKRIGE